MVLWLSICARADANYRDHSIPVVQAQRLVVIGQVGPAATLLIDGGTLRQSAAIWKGQSMIHQEHYRAAFTGGRRANLRFQAAHSIQC